MDDAFQDPSLGCGFHVVLDRQVTLQLRQGDQEGTLVPIDFKLLISGPDQQPDVVRLELNTDLDLFFHYFHSLDLAGYGEVASRQKLKIEFHQYASMLTNLLSRVMKDPDNYLAILYVFPDATARIDFIQNMVVSFTLALLYY